MGPQILIFFYFYQFKELSNELILQFILPCFIDYYIINIIYVLTIVNLPTNVYTWKTTNEQQY